MLTAAECKKANFGRKADNINYSRLYTERGRLLRLAYSRSDIGHNEAFTAFCEKNKWWLDDFALFMAVKGRFEGKPWIEWAEDIRLRWQNAMDYYRRELYFEVEYHKYLQFKFDEQWRRLKAYANSKGVRIIGDIPIYIALDSADAWANPGLFQLDQDSLVPLKSRTNTFTHLAEYPMTDYDISLLVDGSVQWKDVAQTVRGIKSELLHGAAFVDEYRGKQVPAGKKSLTLRLAIGSKDKTLTSAEIEEVASGVLNKIAKRFGAELRR